jgi:hypothetical protein
MHSQHSSGGKEREAPMETGTQAPQHANPMRQLSTLTHVHVWAAAAHVGGLLL